MTDQLSRDDVMSSSRLQEELRKKGPFQSLEQEAMLNIWRTNDQFQNRFVKLFRRHGLTPSQYNILRILRGEGSPLPCLEIASRMIQVVPAITGLLDRLERDGMIQRCRDQKDRRVVYVEITPEAVNRLAELDQPVLELHQQLLGHLSQTEMQTLISLLEKARSPLAETPGCSTPGCSTPGCSTPALQTPRPCKHPE